MAAVLRQVWEGNPKLAGALAGQGTAGTESPSQRGSEVVEGGTMPRLHVSKSCLTVPLNFTYITYFKDQIIIRIVRQ